MNSLITYWCRERDSVSHRSRNCIPPCSQEISGSMLHRMQAQAPRPLNLSWLKMIENTKMTKRYINLRTRPAKEYSPEIHWGLVKTALAKKNERGNQMQHLYSNTVILWWWTTTYPAKIKNELIFASFNEIRDLYSSIKTCRISKFNRTS